MWMYRYFFETCNSLGLIPRGGIAGSYGCSVFKCLSIFLSLAVLGLPCRLGLSLLVVGGLLTVMASLVEQGLWSGRVQYFLHIAQ